MKSERQLAANRANAKKSTGARTKAGKEKVLKMPPEKVFPASHLQVLSCE